MSGSNKLIVADINTATIIIGYRLAADNRNYVNYVAYFHRIHFGYLNWQWLVPC